MEGWSEPAGRRGGDQEAGGAEVGGRSSGVCQALQSTSHVTALPGIKGLTLQLAQLPWPAFVLTDAHRHCTPIPFCPGSYPDGAISRRSLGSLGIEPLCTRPVPH